MAAWPGGTMNARIARYVGGPLNGQSEDLYGELEDRYTAEQIDRFAARPPGWINTEVGVYVLKGPTEDGSALTYVFTEIHEEVAGS